jgi:hypothetical protein
MQPKAKTAPALLAGLVPAVALTLFVAGCDKEGRGNCAWVLEPEPKLESQVDPGMIPVCARNRDSNKEDCRMQTTLERAKEWYGRKFRYTDLAITSPGLPRTISSIKFCDGRD